MSNVIFIGEPVIGKSSLINDMLNVKFEQRNRNSPGMYHDSVDVIFHSKEVPMKFNAFDFHERLANRDWHLIRTMLECLPNCFLFVQVTDKDGYYQEMKREIGELRSQRTFVLLKKHYNPKSDVELEARDFEVEDEYFCNISDHSAGPQYEYYTDLCLKKLRKAFGFEESQDKGA